MIPNLIHQIFIPEAPGSFLNDVITANTKSWVDFNPEFEYRLWNLEEIRALARDLDPRILAVIDVCSFPAMKADIARLMILYLHGGVYADLKFRCLTHFLDRFRDSRLVLIEHPEIKALGRREKYLANGFMIAEPRHEFVRRALYDCVCNVEARIGTGVFDTTGARVLMRLQDEFLPESYGRFENGVGVIRESDGYEKLFSIRGGGSNKPWRHWHERQKVESIYTDCDVRFSWDFPPA